MGVLKLAGDDGNAPPPNGSEPLALLLCESPIEKERSWHHRARPSGFTTPSELYPCHALWNKDAKS